MKQENITSNVTIWRSEVRPDVSIDDPEVAKSIAWADANPRVWKIVTGTKSKAFGRSSCVYIGWAQKSMAPEAILERLSHLHRLVTGTEPHLSANHIMCWRARFTFEHYRDADFTGGFFQQHDAKYPRHCLSLDYTPDTLVEVIDRFIAWCGRDYETARVTVDGKVVREGGDRVMGDASDYAEVGRFMRCPEGQRALDKFQKSLLEKVICDVTFCHLSSGVSVTLHFADGGHLDLTIVEQAFAIESLRQRYGRVLEREYYVDFPERKPGGPRRRAP